MNFYITSDIHLDMMPFKKLPECDNLIIAGDVSQNIDDIISFYRKLSFQHKRVISILGNHDLVGMPINAEKEIAGMINKVTGPFFTMLANDYVILEEEKVMIYGGSCPPASCKEHFRIMEHNPLWHKTFNIDQEIVSQVNQEFRENLAEAKMVAQEKGLKFVVISHLAPTRVSVNPNWATGKPEWLIRHYMDDLSECMDGVCAWGHGHVHESWNYMHGLTHIICNAMASSNYSGDQKGIGWFKV